jgi:hypothetical protein
MEMMSRIEKYTGSTQGLAPKPIGSDRLHLLGTAWVRSALRHPSGPRAVSQWFCFAGPELTRWPES